MSGPPPYGFRRDGDRLVVEPAEAAVLRKLVELFLETRRIKTVARLLNQGGLRTRANDGKGLFSDTTVARLLKDPRGASAIIPEETWRRCQAILEEREREGQRPVRRPAQLFGGRVQCCGSVMRRVGSKLVCTACRARLSVGTLERLLLRELATVLFEPAEILAAFGDHRDKQTVIARALGGRPVRASDVWPRLSRAERLELVDLLVDRILVSRDELTIEYGIPPDSAANRATPSGNALPSHNYLDNEGTRQ